MGERTGGIWFWLSAAALYSLFQNLLGARRAQRMLIAEYIRPNRGDQILDVGCGPADILNFLPPDVRYVGVDRSRTYIEAARRRHGARASFYVGDAQNINISQDNSFQRVLALGLLHHLDDDAAVILLETCRRCLAPGGFLLTMDPIFTYPQNPIARFLIKSDRGLHVRNRDAYFDLAHAIFPNVQLHIRTNILRVPYSHAVMICRFD